MARTPLSETLTDPNEAATRLGEFVFVLRHLDATGAPVESNRGVPLAVQDTETRQAIESVSGEFDANDLTAAWEAVLDAPLWAGTPSWFHGDLHSGNILAINGRLSAVIDLGECGVGDPAVDTMAAWWLFEGDSREEFQQAVQVDADTWNRGRGWALSIALIALPYYINTNPALADMSRTAINNVLGDNPQHPT